MNVVEDTNQLEHHLCDRHYGELPSHFVAHSIERRSSELHHHTVVGLIGGALSYDVMKQQWWMQNNIFTINLWITLTKVEDSRNEVHVAKAVYGE